MNQKIHKEYSEYESNKFNRNALIIASVFTVCLWMLNLFNVFIIDKTIFLKAVISNLLFLGIILITLKIIGLDNKFAKYVLVFGTSITCCAIYVFLTYHAVIVLILPLLLSAIYRNKNMIWYAYFCTAALIYITTVISYDIGLCDANQVLTTSTTTADFIKNFSTLKPIETAPLLHLLLFYAFPRCMCILCAVPILLHITEVIDERTSNLIKVQENNLKLAQEQQDVQRKIIVSLSSIIESRDHVTGDHIHNTERFVHFIIEKLVERDLFTSELTNEYSKLLEATAPLHDVGKIQVPDSILCKPGKLTNDEFEVIKKHTIYGKNIMSDLIGEIGDNHYLDMAQKMALYHHERYDGKGYPYGISSEDIPLCARIMAVADVLDALLSKRQYKEAFSLDMTKEIISKEIGGQFDPRIIEVLLENWDEFEKLVPTNEE